MTESKRETETEKLVELVKRIADQKESAQGLAAAVEQARRIIRERGQFIPKPPTKRGVRISF